MKIEFFLPTEENWCGTYEGGYVHVYINNEKQPSPNGWHHVMIISFSGNDDFMMRKVYDIEEENKDQEFLTAIDIISKIPLPVTKEYLKGIGFEVD